MSVNAVHDFLKTQNRPYNVSDIATNLKDVSKAAVQNALDKLVDSKLVFEKTYGKQKIYCIVQDSNQDLDELKRIEGELERQVTEAVTKQGEIQAQLRRKENELAALKSSLTIDDAKIERDRLLASVAELQKKLGDLTKGNKTCEDLSETKKRLQKDIDRYTREYSKRKRLCGEIVDSILEGFPGTKKELYEEIGMENLII
ncbi:homologous-pairing protein 2 homolog [Athalia rosae]|uniref:homologous-pairing protein 2 homolog n=1 Tax=Athalia rosae TaxID=37344 RepID=UPI002033E6B6|nr:homologous-pairing protein 2 homolog [Athalia rosae]